MNPKITFALVIILFVAIIIVSGKSHGAAAPAKAAPVVVSPPRPVFINPAPVRSTPTIITTPKVFPVIVPGTPPRVTKTYKAPCSDERKKNKEC